MGKNNALAPTKQSGIYEIVNTTNGKRYIGSATQFGHRWSLHRKALNEGKHHSTILQRAWDKYGAAAFEFKILLICEKVDLLQYEQMYFDELKPEYNICITAGSRMGLKNSELHSSRIKAALNTPESQEKLKARFLGKKQSPEHCAARSIGMMGNTNGKNNHVTPEHREKLIAGLRAAHAEGRIHKPPISDELREKRRQVTTARHANTERTPEWEAKVKLAGQKAAATRMARLGPTKTSIARAQAVRRNSPEFGQKISAALAARNAKLTDEQIAKEKARKQAGIAKALATMQAKRDSGHKYVRTPEMLENYRQSALAAHQAKRAALAAEFEDVEV